MACYISLVVFYVIAIPLAAVLVFVLGMDVRGLWIAISIGTMFQAVLYSYLVWWRVDWQAVANESIQRIDQDRAMANSSILSGAGPNLSLNVSRL